MKENTAIIAATKLRLALMRGGHIPIPLYGKEPPIYGKNNARKGFERWQMLREVSPEMVQMWGKTWEDAVNTGVLGTRTPGLDIDILIPDAADAVERLARERFEEHGEITVRFGLAPKRLIPLRTDEPFAKMRRVLIAPDGTEQKIEILADGAQFVCDGTHPQTHERYRWFGRSLDQIPREELPYAREADMKEILDVAAKLLVDDFGFSEKSSPRIDDGGPHEPGEELQAEVERIVAALAVIPNDDLDWDEWNRVGMAAWRATNGADAAFKAFDAWSKKSRKHHNAATPAARWAAYHHSPPTRIGAGTIFYLANHADPNWRQEYEERQAPVIPPPTGDPAPRSTIEETIAVFDEWLSLPTKTPIYAVLGTIAANLLPGDPVWLGLVAPPSSAKTEILNSTSKLPRVVQVATLTSGALLSGSPKKQYAAGSRGGLLRQIGDFGFIIVKDFGSILSLHPETKAELLAALRELFDGAWTRHVGTDGGRALHWKGKLGLIFGVTGVIDTHHSVMSAMGERFLFCRLEPGDAQLKQAMKHVGAKTNQMRKGLSEAVAKLFAAPLPEPRPLSDEEFDFLDHTVRLVVRLRAPVERHRQTREIENIYGEEGTARVGLCLERLLAGLDTLGVERQRALSVVRSVALDSVPPIRRRAYEFLLGRKDATGKTAATVTSEVATTLGLPTNTVRRTMEDLAAYQLVERMSQGQGKADEWFARTLEEAEAEAQARAA